MNRNDDATKEWMARYYSQLKGATIKTVILGIDTDFGQVFPTFEVELADGTKTEIQIWRDEEGNGPGFIQGLELNPQSETADVDDPPPEFLAFESVSISTDHKPEITQTSEGRIVTAVAISETELIHVGPDPDNEGKYRIDLLERNIEDPEALYSLGNLDLDEMCAKSTGLITGTEGVKESLLLEHAAGLLKAHGGEMWHSGGGIMLIALHIGETRITAAPDDGASTFGVEVTSEDGDVLSFTNGLDSNGLVDEWIRQVKKHT